MTFSNDDWAPSPELLAAYFDGEFEGRDDLVPLRRRLEDWLAANPEGRAQLSEYRQLRQIWSETAPPEPAPAGWNKVRHQLENWEAEYRPVPIRRQESSRRSRSARVVAGAAAVFVVAFLFHGAVPVDDQPWPVASEREVVILHVEGADTGTLVIGALPVSGALELAGPGDVTLTSVKPAQRDNMIPDFDGSGLGRPIFWARAEAEED